MKTRILGSAVAVALLSAALFGYAAHPVRGSDHQDAPALVANPAADITDVYMFPSPVNPNNVDLVMDVYPLITPPNTYNVSFDPNILYQFKITHGALGTRSPEDLVIQVQAQGTGAGQKLILWGPTRPTLTGTYSVFAGPVTGQFTYNVVTPLSNGITAYAGPRADPFFFDLFQFFTILPDRNYQNPRTGDKLGSSTPTFNGYTTGSTSGPSGSGYACSTNPSVNALTQINGGFNVLSIVIEVPKTVLMGHHTSSIVHLWGTTSVPAGQGPSGGPRFAQIERLGRPAVKELFETFSNHQVSNHANPYNDPQIDAAIHHFMLQVAGRSANITGVVQTVLYPDQISADLSQPGPAAYLGVETGGATGSKFGGRGLTDNIIDISLGAVFGNTVPALHLAADDGKENNCLTSQHVTSGQGGPQTRSTFPYVGDPHL